MRGTALALVLGVAAGCGSSEILEGTIVGQDGDPLAGWSWSAVASCRNVNYGTGDTTISGEIYSFAGTTDSAGNFEVVIPDEVCDEAGVYISFFWPDQPTPRRALSFWVPDRRSMTLPTVSVWTPEVVVTDGATLGVTWTPLAGEAPTYGVSVPGMLQVETTEPGLSLDARLFQDWTVEATLVAERVLTDLRITVEWVSFARPSFVGAGAPASRGAACTVRGVDDEQTFAAGACPLTAGSMDDAMDEDLYPAGIAEIIIDLGQVTSISGVTFHGAHGTEAYALPEPAVEAIEIAASEDCEVFTPLVTTERIDLSIVAIDVAGVARCVRLRPGDPLATLGEVGIW